jgi:chemotaxis methyl-accepting protein methylase
VTAATELVHGDDAEFRALMQKITRDRGFQCASYKDKCLRRRIAARMRAKGAAGCAEYSRVLDSDEQEYERLMRSLTVNVTKFFRNWETYSAIDQKVVPALFELQEPEIRIWSAGCASGEEPYSVAMLMHRYAASTNNVPRFESLSIVGTDIDTECLDQADRAVYPGSAVGDTPAELRQRYFSESSGTLTVLPEVRRAVTFQMSDLLHLSAPLEQPHLIVCRNVIIYFERDAQDALFGHFHRTLAPGGFLVLGKVETLLGDARALFSPVNARERVFRKI